ADGIYTGDGNWELDFHGRQILVRSANGAKAAIIDCQGSAGEPRRAFTFAAGEDSLFVVDGFTIRGGYGLTFNNAASGGGMFFDGSSPTVKNCIFTNNEATVGGAVYSTSASPRMINCTFVDNNAVYGSAAILFAQSSPSFENCIMAFNRGGSLIYCAEASAAALTCCDLFSNSGGDWTGCISDQNGINGNFSGDPLFCKLEQGQFGLASETSPCVPPNNGCGILIGARDVD
ncbi:MAG: hypothetical protein GY869_15110, partial [Planctomycetes bacterium]|nr:hypothetical protein [Planctomycetota bacterium]